MMLEQFGDPALALAAYNAGPHARRPVVTSKNLQTVFHTRAVVALGAAALIVLAGPALAQSIDLSPVQTLLQGIVDAITGPLGIVIGTLALIGVFLSWLFGILDFRQALWVVVAIAGIAAAPTIVAAIWTT
eukprot:gene11353-biopygen10108